MNDQLSERDLINDDLATLSSIIGDKSEPIIICSYNYKITNFLSILIANNSFYKIFNLSEDRVIGQNYDFLFEDVELDNFSEDRIEYSRLIKAVRDKNKCSIVISSS